MSIKHQYRQDIIKPAFDEIEHQKEIDKFCKDWDDYYKQDIEDLWQIYCEKIWKDYIITP